MNRTLRMALLAAFAVLAVPSLSQSIAANADSWALEALGKMKKVGLLKSYPDGLFKEGRRVSRQEIAVAAHGAFLRLETAAKGLNDQKARIDQVLNQTGDDGKLIFTKEDLQNLRDLLGDAGMVSGELSEFAESAMSLARMASEFEEELSALGIDVEAMKGSLASLASRIGKLEQDSLPFELDVEYNIISHMGHSSDRKFGVTVDGRPTGVGGGSPIIILGLGSARPVGLTKDVNIGHEMALNMNGEVGEIDWKAALAFGNLASGGGVIANAYLNSGSLYGNKSQNQFGQPFHEGESNFYLQNLELKWSGNIARRDAEFRVGRIGYQANPWTFRRMDNTPYFNNRRWDDHNWVFDGADIMFPFRSGSRLDVTFGRQSDRLGSSEGTYGGLWPMTVGEIEAASGIGRLDVAQHFGLNYYTEPCRHMSMNWSWMQLNADRPTNFTGPRGDYNRMDVLGFNGYYTFPCGKTLNFGLAESIYKDDDRTVMGNENRAYWASLPWSKGRASGTVGWRQIEANYGAPGDWGRMGPNWRPVDHKGWNANVRYSASDVDSLVLDTYLYKGMAGEFNQFNASEDMRGFTFDWWKQISPTARFRTGYELFESDDSGEQARFEWLRLGIEHDLGGDTFLNCLYEMSNASTESGTRYRSFYGDRRRGGLLTFQFGRKY